MRNISHWAKHHPKMSRLIIVLSHIVLIITGFFIGKTIAEEGWLIPSGTLIILFCLSFLTALIYPQRTRKGRKVTTFLYTFRKTCDLALVSISFLLMIYLGNRPGEFFNYGSLHGAPNSLIIPKDSTARTYKTVWSFNKSMKDANGKQLSWKERKKLLKAQVRAIKKADDLSNGAKVALIFLSALVALGLLFLVAALACDLSCSGSGAAAVLVGLAGTALIALLLVVVIRAILGKKRKKPKPGPETGT